MHQAIGLLGDIIHDASRATATCHPPHIRLFIHIYLLVGNTIFISRGPSSEMGNTSHILYVSWGAIPKCCLQISGVPIPTNPYHPHLHHTTLPLPNTTPTTPHHAIPPSPYHTYPIPYHTILIYMYRKRVRSWEETSSSLSIFYITLYIYIFYLYYIIIITYYLFIIIIIIFLPTYSYILLLYICILMCFLSVLSLFSFTTLLPLPIDMLLLCCIAISSG